MKRFLGTFTAVFILLCAFMFFAGAALFQNFWAMLALCALVITAALLAFFGLLEQIEGLEDRLRALEGRAEEKKEEDAP